MSNKVDLNYAYGWNRYAMKIIGIWPERRSLNQISSYIALIPILIMFCFVSAPQSANLPFIWGDFDLIVENLSMANITITVSLLKTIIFWLNGESLRMLVLYMMKDWDKAEDKQDRKTMSSIAIITRKLSISSMVFVLNIVVIYTVFRLVVIRKTGHELFFRSYFPYNVTKNPQIFKLTLFGQFAAATYAATSYTAVDTFIATLVLHTCGQLSNVRRELTNLRIYTKAEFQMKLANIVKKHEYLNRFSETIEDSFNMMLLIQMLACSLQLCFQCLQVFMSIMDEIDEVFIFKLGFLLMYVVYIMLQLYLYCYVGEKLLIESTQIAYAAYDCSWYNLSAQEARLLSIVMCRARLPLQITAGRFCSFNLELYSEVLKRSVAYMSFFCAMN